MTSSCCGLCLYGKNQHKYNNLQNECMLQGYKAHSVAYACPNFKRDYEKSIVVKSVKSVNIKKV